MIESKESELSEPIEFKNCIYEDVRGFFTEVFSEKNLPEELKEIDWVQDNLSVSRKEVVRGLHMQMSPHGQAKFVTVLRGSVCDVVVDARPSSPNFGKSKKFYLHALKSSLFIPEGFLHGFISLEQETLFHYKCSSYYNKSTSVGVYYNDPDLGINWPETVDIPIISDQDKNAMSWKEFERLVLNNAI